MQGRLFDDDTVETTLDHEADDLALVRRALRHAMALLDRGGLSAGEVARLTGAVCQAAKTALQLAEARAAADQPDWDAVLDEVGRRKGWDI